MPTITLTKEQLNLVSAALELYSRIGIMQFEEILNHRSISDMIETFFTEKKPLEVGDRTLRGEIVEINDNNIKTKGSWGSGEEIKTWTDIENIKLSPDWGSVHETKDAIQILLNEIKYQITGERYGAMGHLGIHNPDVHDSCRVAFDMYQVIRNAFYKETSEEDKFFYSIASSVHKTSTNKDGELIKVEL